MTIQNLMENVILVSLPKEPQISDELKKVNERVVDSGGCDVILDFFSVEILNSTGIANLLCLRNLLSERGRQLVLCNVAVPTRHIFRICGLDKAFDFADSKRAALEHLQRTISN